MQRSGKSAIRETWYLPAANKFSDGLAWVMIGSKIGYIDKTGKYVINPQFECEGAGDFVEGVSVLSSQAIDKNGKSIWKAAKPAVCETE